MKVTFRYLALTLTLVGMITASSCAGKKPKTEPEGVPTAMDADKNVSGDSDSGKAMGLQTVHFPYDSFVLNQEAKEVLKANAAILKEKSSLKVQIEGHCDQRGGIQYNIALGEKRANAAKNFMIDQGVSADRISTISFGKERPIDNGATEEAYAKNRRGNFVITSQ